MKIGIFGTGAYGLALASILVDNCNKVSMWTKFDEEKKQLDLTRKNENVLPGFLLDDSVTVTTDIEGCLKDKDLLIIAIPVAFIEDLLKELNKYVDDDVNICIASKGIEQGTCSYVNELVSKYINTKNIAVISGPTFAKDIILKKPIGLTLGYTNDNIRNLVEKSLKNEYLSFDFSTDIIGIETCGTVKNVIAIAMGILDGLGANDSSKAKMLTMALKEIKKIVTLLNGESDTVLLYAGVGDLILTCGSTNSRNYSFGKLIGSKTNAECVKAYLSETTVEGFYSLSSIHKLLNDKNIESSIIDCIYDIVYNNKDPELLFLYLKCKV